MFDDLDDESKQEAIDITNMSNAHMIKKKEQMETVQSVRQENEKAEAMAKELEERKQRNEESELSKTTEEAVQKALKKKYLEEQKKREAFFKAEEEKKQKEEWLKAQEEEKKTKGKLSFNTLVSSFLPKSSGELTDKETRKIQKENEKLKQVAFKDTLTGLFNRNKYEEDIKDMPVKELICISVDANNLKYMNDNFGYEAGDKLLKAIADDLKKNLSTKNIYRTGGDEYICFFVGAKADKVALELIGFEESLEKRNSNKEDLVYSASYGMAEYIKGDTVESLQKRADEKMYDMKKAYKTSHPKYDMRKRQTDKSPVETSVPKKDSIVIKTETKSTKPSLLRPKTKGKTVVKKANVLPPIIPVAKPDLEDIKTADFIQPHGSNEFTVNKTDEEYITMKDRLKQIKNETRQDEVVDMLDEINELKASVTMICLVSQDLNTLFLIRTAEAFFDACEKLDDDIAVSYIYVLYKGTGIKYYMQKPDEKLIQDILQHIANLFMKNNVVTSAMIAGIPNIGIFQKVCIL